MITSMHTHTRIYIYIHGCIVMQQINNPGLEGPLDIATDNNTVLHLNLAQSPGNTRITNILMYAIQRQ